MKGKTNMALTDEGTNTTMLVQPSGMGNGGLGFGDNGWWIILLFILLGGWGNGFGNGFGGGMDGIYPWMQQRGRGYRRLHQREFRRAGQRAGDERPELFVLQPHIRVHRNADRSRMAVTRVAVAEQRCQDVSGARLAETPGRA